MAEKIKNVKPPRGFARVLWRIPITLYRIGLGGLLGKRFLLLNHLGRKSGTIRQAVVEVVKIDHSNGYFYSVSGFGPKSDWYQNLVAHPEVTIQIGTKKMGMRAVQVSALEAQDVLLDYNQQYPGALKALSRILGYSIDDSEEDVRFIASIIPMIRFEPK